MAIHSTVFTFLSIMLAFQIQAQTENDLGVMKPINLFIEGTTYNYPEKITKSFLPAGRMFLYNDADTLMDLSVEEYAAFYDNGRRSQQNQRFSTLITLDIVGSVAYAKLQVDIPSYSRRYYDLLLLKKIGDEWKIVSKCTDAMPLPQSPQEAKPKPTKEVILDNLAKPWSMAFITENETIIAEKDGTLLLADLITKTTKAIQGLPDDIAGEILIDTSQHPWGTFPPPAHNSMQRYNAGLFQILLDPSFSKNQLIYLSYAAQNEDKASVLKVIRAKLQDGHLIDIKTLFIAGSYSHGLFHYGGGMLFGTDGKLYISTGERNLFEQNNPSLPFSQDPKDGRGKIIRINPDGSIPEDNPNFGSDAVPGLYAIGIRAAQGLTLNPKDNSIWFSEHGTLQGDEVNKLVAGANYGWPYKTSGKYRTASFAPKFDANMDFTDPIYFWYQTVAPSGLTFYFGRVFPQWHGSLIVPGLSKGSLWRLQLEGEAIIHSEELFINDRVRLRKAIVSPRGQLYILTDEADGKLIKISQSKE